MFDYDAVGNDDCMGLIRIPGHALFNLGHGHRMFCSRWKTPRRKSIAAKRSLASFLEVSTIDLKLSKADDYVLRM